MRTFLSIMLAFAASAAVAAPASTLAELAALQRLANNNILASLKNAATNSSVASSCTIENLAIRREYGSLSQAERKEYTDAVLCLQAKGSNTPADLVPGAKSRFDDFVATHINQTLTIHYTGTFLAWHRYFTWTYEQALREECGYTGYQPYWNWPQYSTAPQNSPIFNGDAYSLSGNGKYENYSALEIVQGSLGTVPLPRGLGGGCIYDGPFKDMVVNLGPVSLTGSSEVGPDGGLGYNPRCLKRDVGPGVANKFTNITAVIHLLLANDDIESFQLEMQGVPGSGSIGVHGGGHYTIGGDPGGDLFVSPGDPAFWVHHGQIDRIWTIWQALDPKNRQYAISGTGTFLNSPPSANTTLQTPVELGWAPTGGENDGFLMQDLMSTLAGPFCYIYV